ncbi:MAG: hypothetical protein JNJ45_09030 [Chthonomonas sp.]|nr:hypothetical protein [Chthonomonas sp.]
MDRSPRVWTGWTKFLGNAVPGLFCLPLLVAGILHFNPQKPFSGWPIYMILFVIVGWFAVSLFGFWNNDGLRQGVARQVDRRYPPNGEKPVDRHFVGVARPSYRNILDPHEDVGFLLMHDDRLQFVGDQLDLEFPWTTFSSVRGRANTHTWLGLGRWISLEGTGPDDLPIRLMIEPRERNFIPANWSVNRKLRAEIASRLDAQKKVDSSGA